MTALFEVATGRGKLLKLNNERVDIFIMPLKLFHGGHIIKDNFFLGILMAFRFGLYFTQKASFRIHMNICGKTLSYTNLNNH